MYSLELLGGLSLEGPEGRIVGRAAQKRHLSLLTLLALEDGPISRDKVVGYLWPEEPESRARRHLSDALYVLRKELGEEIIHAPGDDLELNRTLVESDVAAFEQALARGEAERAAELYDGPLLDGVHLRSSSAFERRVDRERKRLEREAARALEGLATAADDRGDLEAAIRWWRRLAATKPYSSRVSLALMRALERAGERAEALEHARVHELLVRDELGAEPDPSVLEFAERLRTAGEEEREPAVAGEGAGRVDRPGEAGRQPGRKAPPSAGAPPSREAEAPSPGPASAGGPRPPDTGQRPSRRAGEAPPWPTTFFRELKRRKVVRVALVYGAVGWLLIEVADTVVPNLGLPGWVPTLVIFVVAVGFPVAVLLAWAFEVTPEGVRRTSPGERAGRLAEGKRWGWWAAGVLTLGALVVVAGATGLFDLPPVEVGAGLERDRVLVAAFENRTGDASLDPVGYMAADWISQGLLSTGFVKVVPFSTVMRETPYLRASGPDTVLTAAGRLAEDAGAGLMVSGAYYVEGDSLLFRARVVDVASGELLREIGDVRAAAERPEAGATALRRRTAGTVAALLDRRLASWGNPASQPPSLEAYQLYAEGLELFLQAQSPEEKSDREEERLSREAASRFLAAGAEDSTFTAPLLWAVFAHKNAGDQEKARALANRLDRREHLLPWDRALLDYQLARMDGEQDAAFRAARRLVEMSPDSEWLFKLGAAAMDARRLDAALEAFTRLDMDRGWIRHFRTPAYLLVMLRHWRGEHEQELAAARRGARLHPGAPYLRILELFALAALGREGEVLEKVEAGLASDDRVLLRDLHEVISELRAHGHPEAADRVFRRAVAHFDSMPEAELARRPVRRGFANVLYAGGRWDRAHALFERLAELQPRDPYVKARLGALAARRGNREDALRLSRSLAAWPDRTPEEVATLTARRAGIAAQLGDHERALELLEEAFKSLKEQLWIHRDPDFQPLSGDPGFQRLLRSRG